MRTPSELIGRTGALLAATSAVLHGAALGPDMTPWVGIVAVAMLAGCLYCAYELLTRDTLRAWVLVAVMNLAMVAVHLPMTGAHQHGGGVVMAPAASTVMQLATVVATVEVLLAAAVLFVRTRARAPAVIAPCQSGHHDCGGTTGRPAARDLD